MAAGCHLRLEMHQKRFRSSNDVFSTLQYAQLVQDVPIRMLHVLGLQDQLISTQQNGPMTSMISGSILGNLHM